MIFCEALKKLLSVNSSASGFTAKSAMIAVGVNDGNPAAAPNSSAIKVANADGPGGYTPCKIRLFPYGLGSDNDVFSLRIWGWWRLNYNGAPYWLASILGEIACTISAHVGVAGGPVLNTERFADTITIVREYVETADSTPQGTILRHSPTNDSPASVIMPLFGAEFIEPDWDQTTGTPTMNALYNFITESE